jgi:4-alpha-glucanotransferase
MTSTNSGRIYSSPNIQIFKDYCKYTDSEYNAIFEKIIFPAAEKYGIKRNDIICEDLGDQTLPVKRAIEKLNLTGLSVTQFGYSGVDAPERNVIMLGSHDNQSYIEYTDNLFARASSLGEGRDRFMYKTHILGSDTVTPEKDINLYREEIRKDKKKFMTASFAELFTSPAKKVQIFFTDFFGIGKTYNVPGTKKDCWTLRLNSNFEDLYYDNLKKGLGINLPEVIAIAIRQKGKDFSDNYTQLLRKLDYFTYIFKN